MRIEDLNIKELPKAALKEYGHNFVEEAEKVESITAEMQMWWLPVKESFTEVERIYLIGHKSDLTEDLQTLRSQRYGVLAAMKGLVLSYMKSGDEKIRKAATSIWNTMGTFPVKPNVTYNTQTGQFDALLEVLKGRQAENVALLNLDSLVEEMDALNQQFHALLTDRNEENIDKTKGDFQQARDLFHKAYRDFVVYVNAYYLVKCITEKHEDAQLKFFIEYTNSMIDNYKRTVLRQPTSSPEAGDPAENPDAPQTPEDVETPDGGNNEDNENQQPEDNENNGGSGGGNNETGGGTTNPPSGPNTDAWGDGDEGDGSDV